MDNDEPYDGGLDQTFFEPYIWPAVPVVSDNQPNFQPTEPLQGGQNLLNQQGSLSGRQYDQYGLQQPTYGTSGFSDDYFQLSSRASPAYHSSSYGNSVFSDPCEDHGNYSVQNPLAAHNTTVAPQNLEYGMSASQQLSHVSPPLSYRHNSFLSRESSGNTPNFGLFQPQPNQQDLYLGDHQASLQRGVSYGYYNAEEETEEEQDGFPNAHYPLPISLTRTAPTSTLVAPSSPARSSSPDLPFTLGPYGKVKLYRSDLYNNKNTSILPRLQKAPYLTWSDTPIQLPESLRKFYRKDQSRSTKRAQNSTTFSKSSGTNQSTGKGLSTGQITSIRRPSSNSGPGGKRSTQDGDASARTPTVTPSECSSLDEGTDSLEESDFEEEMVLKDISEIRGASRPTSAPEAARWDTLGYLWKDPNSNPSSEVISTAMKHYGDYVSNLRNQIKQNGTDAQAARVAKDSARMTILQDTRQILLDSLYASIHAAVKEGYIGIIEHLGQHEKLINGLTTTLVECNRAEDFLGRLPKVIFELLSKIQMKESLLERLKFDSIKKRWAKRGDNDIMKAIRAIEENTVEAKERKDKKRKEAIEAQNMEQLQARNAQVKASRAAAEKAKLTSGLNPAKRPYQDDGSSSNPTKKMATASTGSQASRGAALKRGNPLADNLLGHGSKLAPKFFPKKQSEPSLQESFVGGLIEDIRKPPEPPKKPASPIRPPEPPEEKARRERKESRRHLRVKFVEGDALEQIRLFKHEQAEDEGREVDMLRDAHDNRSEGLRLLKRATTDGEEAEVRFERPYSEPSMVDFSVMVKFSRYGLSFSTRGGDLAVSTPEQQTQKRREAVELMVIYRDDSEIPPSPREPPASETGSLDIAKRIPGPIEYWFETRLNTLKQYGPSRARLIEIQNMEEQRRHLTMFGPYSLTPYIRETTISPSVQQEFIARYLEKAEGNALYTKQAELKASEYLWNVSAPLRNTNSRFAECPPSWMHGETKKTWLEGFEKDRATKAPRVIGSTTMVPSVQGIESNASPGIAAYQPLMMTPSVAAQIVPQMSAPQLGTPLIYNETHGLPPHFPQVGVSPHGASFIANSHGNRPLHNLITATPTFVAPTTLQNNNNTQNNTLHGMQNTMQVHYNNLSTNRQATEVPVQEFDFNSWAKDPQGYFQKIQQQSWDRDVSNDDTGYSKPERNKIRASDGKQRGSNKQWRESMFDESGDYLGKKRPCTFYREGNCTKGSKCTFLHE